MVTHVGYEDPFDIPLDQIPEGRVYQWVTLTVRGRGGLAYDQTGKMRAANWEYVPPNRHPKFFDCRDKERIEVGGLVLMENSVEHVAKSREEEAKKAFNLIHGESVALGLSKMTRVEWEKYLKKVAEYEKKGAPISSALRGAILPSPTRLIGSRWKQRRDRVHWLWVRIRYNLTMSEIDCALDGTIPWNRTQKNLDEKRPIGKPIGIVEYARRKRIMNKPWSY